MKLIYLVLPEVDTQNKRNICLFCLRNIIKNWNREFIREDYLGENMYFITSDRRKTLVKRIFALCCTPNVNALISFSKKIYQNKASERPLSDEHLAMRY